MNKIRANKIVQLALQIRKKYLNVSPNRPICPFNLADAMELDIRFVKIPSFEGMYLADQKMILISAERPEGRKRFTCAHEIGHHILDHGTSIDEMIEHGPDIVIEKEADLFASCLLMPSSLIRMTANNLKIDFHNIEPEKMYVLAKYIGVSFIALITHIHFTLKLISNYEYIKLKKTRLKDLKRNIYNMNQPNNDVFKVGNWWKEKAIDAVIGDVLILDNICEYEGISISKSNQTGEFMFKCIKPGISKIYNSEWSAFVRVSRSKFVGMYQYRHEEEEE